MTLMSARAVLKKSIKARASYLGVVSAALIFFSWVLSSFALDNATRVQAALRDAITKQQGFHRYLDLIQKLNNAEKQLTRIELYRRSNDSNPNQIVEDLTRAGDALQWVDNWASDVSELYEYADSLRDFATQVPAGNSSRADVAKNTDAVYALAKQFFEEGDRWKKHFSELTGGSNSFSLTHPPTNSAEIAIAASGHYQESRKIVEQYLPLMNNLHMTFRDLTVVAQNSADRVALVASLSRWLVYIVFVLGTALSIYAKHLESIEKAKTVPIESATAPPGAPNSPLDLRSPPAEPTKVPGL